ncbi:MAG TPA: hypothetical protein VMT75_10500 [Candidatus Saccharimonadales bacterium]|nr:hypothetical protein [Candidatus Saccharimonadales bacterium]
MAEELQLRHISDVTVNEFGAPLLDDLFGKAEAVASHPHMCYVNADIILRDDFLRAMEIVLREMPKSLAVSKRINVDICESLDFTGDWEASVRRRVAETGADGHYTSIDIFTFPKGMYPKVPAFAIGRLWYDHWLIKAVRDQNLPVIDLSLVSPLLHQNHDYNHVPGGADQVWRGKEAERNHQLSGGASNAYTMLDVTHELMPDGRIRRVRYRKELQLAKTAMWEVFVNRTARVRHALGLRKRRATSESRAS